MPIHRARCVTRSRFSGGVTSGASSDEPDMSSIGTLVKSYSATDWAAYADVNALGNDTSTPFSITPIPSMAMTGTAVNTAETILTSPGRLGSGKVAKMMWTGDTQYSATFGAFPLNYGRLVVPDGMTHYLQFWAKMTIGGTGAFKLAGHSQGINVKFAEGWQRHTGGRTQFNTRYSVGDNPTTATASFELIDNTEVLSTQPGGQPGDADSQQPIGPYPEDLWNSIWHRFTIGIRMGSSTDKFQRMWADGVKIIDCSLATIGVVPPGGNKVWCTQREFDRLAENDTIDTWKWGDVQTGDVPSGQCSNPWDMQIDNIIWRYAA